MRTALRPTRLLLGALLALLGMLAATAAPAPAQTEGESPSRPGEATTQSFVPDDLPALPTVEIEETPAAVQQGPAGIDPVVADAAEGGDPVDVLVELDVATQLDATLSDSAASAQRDQLADATSAAADAVTGAGGAVRRTFEDLPWLSAQLTGEQIDLVVADPTVRRVTLDAQYDSDQSTAEGGGQTDTPSLATTQTLIGASQAWAQGYRGQGRNVAIIDSGVLHTHPFFANGVVAGACFSSDGTQVDGGCPNNSSTQFGIPAGDNCTFDPTCDHGTHVAGIAAGGGNGFTASGVANGSGIVAVRAAGRNLANNQSTFRTSDLLASLQWLYSNRSGLALSVVNMSLGGGGPFVGNECSGHPLEGVINNLRSVGIPTVIATGNDGFNNGVAQPACIVGATAVGNTDKATDTVHPTSDSGDLVDLLAPGSGADVNCPGGGIASSVLNDLYGCKTGTSMAAPHVAGAMALLDQKAPNATVSTFEAALIRSGVNVTDPDNNITRSRINVNDALRILFRDVPFGSTFYEDISWLAYFNITTGFNNGTEFRPTSAVTRQAMAAFLYRLAGEPNFSPGAPSFSDVPSNHPFFKEIEWLASVNVAGGYADGTYRSGAQVTRQAMAAFMHRFDGNQPPGPGPSFVDVSPSHPFFQDIAWMAAEGISTGYADNTYRPAANVSRQAMAAFMFRLAN